MVFKIFATDELYMDNCLGEMLSVSNYVRKVQTIPSVTIHYAFTVHKYFSFSQKLKPVPSYGRFSPYFTITLLVHLLVFVNITQYQPFKSGLQTQATIIAIFASVDH